MPHVVKEVPHINARKFPEEKTGSRLKKTCLPFWSAAGYHIRLAHVSNPSARRLTDEDETNKMIILLIILLSVFGDGDGRTLPFRVRSAHPPGSPTSLADEPSLGFPAAPAILYDLYELVSSLRRRLHYHFPFTRYPYVLTRFCYVVSRS